MTNFSISMTGTKAQITNELHDLESPPTDAPHYAGHCHAKQHIIDFVNRCDPSSSISISVSGGVKEGKAFLQASMVEG